MSMLSNKLLKRKSWNIPLSCSFSKVFFHDVVGESRGKSYLTALECMDYHAELLRLPLGKAERHRSPHWLQHELHQSHPCLVVVTLCGRTHCQRQRFCLNCFFLWRNCEFVMMAKANFFTNFWESCFGQFYYHCDRTLWSSVLVYFIWCSLKSKFKSHEELQSKYQIWQLCTMCSQIIYVYRY
jgi:hypothetical protein